MRQSHRIFGRGGSRSTLGRLHDCCRRHPQRVRYRLFAYPIRSKPPKLQRYTPGSGLNHDSGMKESPPPMSWISTSSSYAARTQQPRTAGRPSCTMT